MSIVTCRTAKLEEKSPWFLWYTIYIYEMSVESIGLDLLPNILLCPCDKAVSSAWLDVEDVL